MDAVHVTGYGQHLWSSVQEDGERRRYRLDMHANGPRETAESDRRREQQLCGAPVRRLFRGATRGTLP